MLFDLNTKKKESGIVVSLEDFFQPPLSLLQQSSKV